MRKIAPFILLVAPLLAGPPTSAGDLDKGPAGLIVMRHCTVEYDRDSLVGASMQGLLQDCLVKPGDAVKAGQILGNLQDRDARAELELRTFEAASDIDVRVGEARRLQAKNKLAISESLFGKRALSYEAVYSDRLDLEAATLAVEAAHYRRALAAIEKRRAEVMLRMRQLISPHDGIVVKVLKMPGEPISFNEAIFRVANVDRLRVTGSLDVSDAWKPRKGQRVRIWPEIEGAEMSIEGETFEGHVQFVDAEIDPLTSTCKVFAEVVNRDGLLRSGLKARMEIPPADAAPPAK